VFTANTGNHAVAEKCISHSDYRAKRKEDNANIGIVPKRIGRPNLEEAQAGLLETIVDLITADGDAAADPKRMSLLLETLKTVEDLHAALLERRYILSRSSVGEKANVMRIVVCL
jgi:hypothetical protein